MPLPKRLFHTTAGITAVAYPLSLLTISTAFFFIGESWWPVLTAMYLPPWGWALPLPAVVLTLLLARRWRLLALQLVSVALLVFPLMGLELNRAPAAATGPTLRVYTRNVHQGVDGLRTMMEEIARFDPDLVVLQESRGKTKDFLRKRFPAWQMHEHDEFVLLTRHRIVEAFVAPPVKVGRISHSARFVRYTVDTPLGPLDVFNVHPISPRDALEEIRGRGLTYEVRSGRLFGAALDGRLRASVDPNTRLRVQQIQSFSALAAASPRPVLIAGDTNLPGPSRVRRQLLAGFQDAFSTAGKGFGYTFPAHHPWLRLDRILANDRLTFTRVERGGAAGSDHVAVIAEISRR